MNSSFLVCYIITTVALYYLHPMMSPKRLSSSPASGKEPKHENVELLDMVREGKCYAAVGRHYGVNDSTVRYYGVNESTVRYIKKNGNVIRSSVASSFVLRW